MHTVRLIIPKGGSALGKDIPPFVITAELNYVFGLNAIGLRRAGFSREERDEIKRAFKLIYLSGLNTRQALEKSRESEWTEAGREFFGFVSDAMAERGICPFKRGTEQEQT